MNITRLRLWCRTHDLVVQFRVDQTVYQIDVNGLSCQSDDGKPCRVREGQISDILVQNPDISCMITKRALQGLGDGNVWTLEELEEAIGAE